MKKMNKDERLFFKIILAFAILQLRWFIYYTIFILLCLLLVGALPTSDEVIYKSPEWLLVYQSLLTISSLFLDLLSLYICFFSLTLCINRIYNRDFKKAIFCFVVVLFSIGYVIFTYIDPGHVLFWGM